MSDLALAAVWFAVLASGIAAAVFVHQLGLAATHVRDLLHVGAGVWVIGWPWWNGALLPIALVAGTALVVAAVPALARHHRAAVRLHDAVTGDDERWGGLVLYTASYAIFTVIGLAGDPLPAAAALLALSLGDGVGGAVGRRFGRHHYRAPGGKRKSLEGSAAVAIMAMVGAALAAALVGGHLGAARILFAGAVAATAEAAAPRGTDNVIVPAGVWLGLTVVT
jgi:dolichol kinase